MRGVVMSLNGFVLRFLVSIILLIEKCIGQPDFETLQENEKCRR